MPAYDIERRSPHPPDFLAAAGALTATAFLPPHSPCRRIFASESIDDDFGLPAYHYTGPLRFPSSPVYDDAPMLPNDPFFLLGDPRHPLRHASGALQLLTGGAPGAA